MLALTVRQPYAQLIVLGIKRAERRVWPTYARGRIAIHAGRRLADDATHEQWVLAGEAAPRSAIVGVVDVLDCVRADVALPHAPDGDAWHWLLGNAVVLAEPVVCDGRLGFWRPTSRVQRRVLAQV